MNLADRRYLVAWLAVLAIVGGSFGITAYRLAGLPDLGMQLGPSLQVRSVGHSAYRTSETLEFKPGDYFVALEGSTLKQLRDLRVVLRSLPPAKKLRGVGEESGLRYQVLRHRHRYTISWQGNRSDPTALPPGYNPETDVLVEIDGRRLPEAVGPEGVRSVLGHRSDALLTFERHNAVFQGTVAFWRGSWTWSVPLLFLFVAALVVLLWLYHSRELPRWSPVAVAAETVAFGWILLLSVAYQWLLADRLLASLTIVGLIAVRPLAIFARSRAARDEEDAVGWWALGLGGSYALLVLALLHGGALPNAETGLYAGACGAAFYLLYELFAVAFDDAPHTTLQEGGGYLAGILVVGFATAIFIWQFQGEAFRLQLWRWFAIAFTALVGFGDLLFCFRGPSGMGYEDLLTSDERREGIKQYFETVAEDLPDARLAIVLRRDEMFVTVEHDGNELTFEPTDERVADLVSILWQEEGRIPLGESGDRGNSPLSGLAQTMDIVLALRLRPPPGAMELPGTDIALLAFEENDDSELPAYASAETIDRAQTELAPSTWAALFIEGMAHLPGDPEELLDRAEARTDESSDEGAADAEAEESSEGADGDESDRAPEEGEPGEYAERLERAEERIELLRSDRSSLASQVQMAERRLRAHAPPVEEYERLLEPELIETLEYLLESDEPIAVGGPYGAGREFTARCAAEIAGHPPEAFVVYDALEADADDHRDHLFGAEEETDTGYVDTAVGASLLIRSAGLLSDTLLVGLCNSSIDRDIRLFLSFHEPEIETHSPLDERPPRVVEKLEHRELMIPSLRQRRSILPNVLNYYLEYYSTIRRASAEAFSDEALAALRNYSYPAEVREAQLIVDLAVLRSEGDRIEFEDLNAEVRRQARPSRETGSETPIPGD